ncbi:enoyl-CoA hydratase-related protein [Tuberibacillus sp. Marseille-P3662]|uniref:enoyl-CoA hydratase-related protein n=1 Tax=Tuberibacillus sp. Marseille-P3662 TaxID=1965358 RepID=UPI000A1CD0EB|nr:enoyl-CoA hydratase-related protein [Tuberibacillus sp. Marseille-P3662]
MRPILCEINNHVATITLNRPEVLNCFNFEMLEQLESTVQNIATDKDVSVVIITGAGEKAFSAGADLKERKTLNEQQVRRNVKKIGGVFEQIAELPQPTIAAVNGYAFGGGFELALACDFRFAVEDAKMGLTETSMGIIPGAGGTQRLPRLIGEDKAMELVLTAKRLTSEEARDYGVLTSVTSREQLIHTCSQLAERMQQNAPVAVKQAKYAIRNGMNTDLHTGLNIESKAYDVTIPTQDRVEALTAFNDKRKPEFTGE